MFERSDICCRLRKAGDEFGFSAESGFAAQERNKRVASVRSREPLGPLEPAFIVGALPVDANRISQVPIATANILQIHCPDYQVLIVRVCEVDFMATPLANFTSDNPSIAMKVGLCYLVPGGARDAPETAFHFCYKQTEGTVHFSLRRVCSAAIMTANYYRGSADEAIF